MNKSQEVRRMTEPLSNVFLAVTHLDFISLMERDAEGTIWEIKNLSADAYECVVMLGNVIVKLTDGNKYKIEISEVI